MPLSESEPTSGSGRSNNETFVPYAANVGFPPNMSVF